MSSRRDRPQPPGLVQEIRQIYWKEVRDLARDRHTILYSFLLPLFLYPALVWGALQVVVYARGIEDRAESRVLILGEAGEDLGAYLNERKSLKVVSVKKDVSEDFLRGPESEMLNQARGWIREGAIHAVMALEGGPARVFFSAASDSSVKAKERLQNALESYRKDRLLAAVRSAGKDESLLDVISVEEEDLASRQELSNYIASLILPLLMIVMTAMGALYPALDATVGEKERSTLETTLVSPARRESTVLGKYFAVVTFSLLAFFINLTSMGFTLFHLRDQMKLEGLSLGVGSAAVIVCGAVLLALFLSAIMMLLGFMARSFKEGQTYVTPVYLVSVLPAMLVSSPDVTLTPGLACIPLVNLSLLFREALKGRFPAAGIALTLALSLLYALLSLAIAARFLKREAFATGAGLSLRDVLAVLWPRPKEVRQKSRLERQEGASGDDPNG